jgi:hypothetical protein
MKSLGKRGYYIAKKFMIYTVLLRYWSEESCSELDI